MIKLTDWYLTEHVDESNYTFFYLAWGYVFGHTKLSDGEHIHTSGIESIRFENNILVLVTHSQNQYTLSLTDINLDRYEETRDYLSKLNISIPSFEVCEKLVSEANAKELSRINGVLKDGELYLKMSGFITNKAYWKNTNIREIKVYTHTGMFQDSYLIIDYLNHEVDFRYFDTTLGIEPYHYSDGIKAILVENIGSEDIKFSDGDCSIICKVGEVTRIENKYFHSEGLISPDVVNGKSALVGRVRDTFKKDKSTNGVKAGKS